MIKKINYLQVLMAICFSWFVVKIILCFLMQHIVSFEAHEIAVNMINSGEMELYLEGQYNYNYQFPVYPFLLFLVYKLNGINPFGGIILNGILHVLSVILGYYLFLSVLHFSVVSTIKKHHKLISFLSALFILFHPAINYYVYNTVHPFVLDLLLLLTTCYFLFAFFNTNSKLNYLLFSLSFALCCLNRFSFVVLLVPLLLHFITTKTVLRNINKLVFTVVCCCLVLTPWVIRNYTYYHKISINSSFGQNLWIGIQDKTEGTAYLPNGDNYRKLLPKADFKKTLTLNPAEQSDFFTQKYIAELKENPMHVLNMYFKKLNNFWFFSKNIGMEQGSWVKNLIPLYKIAYLCMLLLAISLVYHDKNTFSLLVSLVVSISLFQAMFYVETRHRIIIEPLLFFMALCSVFFMLKKQKN